MLKKKNVKKKIEEINFDITVFPHTNVEKNRIHPYGEMYKNSFLYDYDVSFLIVYN